MEETVGPSMSAALSFPPGKNAVRPRTIAAFTYRAKPDGLSSLRDALRGGAAIAAGADAVLCQLTKPGRPSMWFLSIDLRV